MNDGHYNGEAPDTGKPAPGGFKDAPHNRLPDVDVKVHHFHAPLTLTRAQADEFLNKAFGFRTLGVADDQEVVEAWSPALRSFFIGVAGQQPATYSGITPRDKRATTASLLRAVADALDPQQGGE